MNGSITFAMLWKIFKETWLKILIIALAAALLSGVFTEFMITKKYSSTIKFYVINDNNDDQSFEQEAIYKTKDLLAAEYIEIIYSDKVILPLAQELQARHGVEYSPLQLKRMISSKIVADIGVFDITVTSANSEYSLYIAQLVAEILPGVIKDIKNIVSDQREFIMVLNHPALATTHSSPNLFKNVVLAGMLGAFISYLIFLLINVFDNVIKTGNDLKVFTEKYPLLGVIPEWHEYE